jgi:hypothetical protein
MMRRVALGLWSALLPASERELLLERLDEHVPTVGASWALGVLQVCLIPIWALLGIGYTGQVVGVQSESILAQECPPTFTEAMLASIALGPLAFLVTPQGLLLEYLIVTGVVRLAGLLAADRPTGDPIVTVLAALGRFGRAEVRHRRRLRTLGPWRPDRILREGARLVVLSSRDKLDWNQRVTIEHAGALYHLERREERPHGRWIDVAYVLRPHQPGELVRSLVHLGPAPEAASAESRGTTVDGISQQGPARPPAAPGARRSGP